MIQRALQRSRFAHGAGQEGAGSLGRGTIRVLVKCLPIPTAFNLFRRRSFALSFRCRCCHPELHHEQDIHPPLDIRDF